LDVQISGRHLEVTEAMEKHIRSRIEKLPRYEDQIRSVRVILELDSDNHKAEVIAKCHKSTLVAEASSYDMYASIEQAFCKMEQEVRRFHDKLIHGKARKAQKASEKNKRQGPAPSP